MANSLPNAYIKTFESIVRYLAQQKMSKLLPYAQKRSGTLGESHSWSRVGQVTAVTKTGRAVETPIQDTPFSNRIAMPTDKQAGDLVEPSDVEKMLIDPKSAISTAIGYAMARSIDDQLIAAATGTALDSSGNANAFPLSQGIGYTSSTGGLSTSPASISLSLIAQASAIFLKNDIDPDVPKVAVVSPGQVQQLIQIDKATSEFYVKAKALAENGFVTNFMGFNWVMSNRLTQTSAGVSQCLFMSDQAMGFMMDKDIWTRAEERPDLSFAWQIYSEYTGGAVRVEDEHIVRMDCTNAFI